MKIRISFSITFVAFLLFALSSYSAVVYINPATIDSPAIGESLQFDIEVKDVVDLTAFQIEVSFSNTAIKLVSITEGNFLKSGFGNDPSVDGTIPFVMTTASVPPKTIPFASITPATYTEINSVGKMVVACSRYSINELKGVDGVGTLIKLGFEVLEGKASNMTLNAPFDDPNLILVNSQLGVIEAQLSGATISEATACVKGDIDGDGNINAKDAILALQFSAEIKQPNPQELCAADMNDDGNVLSNDAIRILRKAVGLEAPARDIPIASSANTKIKMDEIHGIAGDYITIPLRISDADIIAGGDIAINYDPNVLEAPEILYDEGALLVSNTTKAGIIKISFAKSNGFRNDKLAEIKFHVVSDNISRLTIQHAMLYKTDLTPITPKIEDGLFASWAVPARDNALLQNFPNPFNPETWIPFQLKQDGEVAIRIYSAAGELVRELNLGNRPAGIYVSQDRAAYWDGKDKFGMPVASGIYFYSIKTDNFSAVKKLIVIK